MEEKEEKKEQTMLNGGDLLNIIIAKTFARHSKLGEEDYLKEIGFEGAGKTEDEAIRVATFNLLVETTRQLLLAEKTLKNANKLIKMCLLGEKEEKNKDKGEK